MYFSPGDSFKRSGGVIEKCLGSDAVINVKGMDGTMVMISQYMRDSTQALKGGLLLKGWLHLSWHYHLS